MENLLWRWKNLGKLQGNTSHYYYYCCTDDLTGMDSSQRVWTSTFYIVYLPCFRRAGGQYPTSLLMLVVHITHTKSICAEVAPIAFWVVSASTKFSTTRCSCPHHQLVELTVALAVGPLAWAMPAEVVCIVWRFSLSTCCCCNSAVLGRCDSIGRRVLRKI